MTTAIETTDLKRFADVVAEYPGDCPWCALLEKLVDETALGLLTDYGVSPLLRGEHSPDDHFAGVVV